MYHLRQHAIVDGRFLERAKHMHMALLARLGRTLVFGLVLLVLRSLLRDDVVAADFHSLGALLLVIVLIALAESYAALNWIHWGSTHDAQAAGLALFVLLISACISGVLLVLFSIRRELTDHLLPCGAGHIAAQLSYLRQCCLCAGLPICLPAVRRAWRAADIDHAQRLGQTSL